MAEFRQIKISLFLILVLQFTAAANGQPSRYLTVRVGDEVTLPCDSLINDHNNCDLTQWLFDGSLSALQLVYGRNIVVEDKSKFNRLSVTENCSLVIKNVTNKDVSRYTCRQMRSVQRDQNSFVHLSVVNMSEQKGEDNVTLKCSVLTHQQCRHTVKWLFHGQDVDKDNQQMRTSQSTCSASVTFPTSHFSHTSDYNLFKCAVTDRNKVQRVFPFSSPRPTGEDTRTAKTKPPTTTTGNSTEQHDWRLYIIVTVLVALLIITVTAITCWKRTKRNNTQANDKVGLTSNPAVTQSATETTLYMVDPENGVSYASISYTKKANSKAQVRSKNDDDEGGAVTYSTLKASSYDPGNPYIN